MDKGVAEGAITSESQERDEGKMCCVVGSRRRWRNLRRMMHWICRLVGL